MARLEQWLGGSPLAILLKLAVLSLVVGIALAALGLTPLGLLRGLADAFQSVFGFGLDAVRNFGQYILTGAVIVIPIWFLSRLLGARR